MGAPAPSSEHHEHRPVRPVAGWVERAVGYRLGGFEPGVHLGLPSGVVTFVLPLGQPLVLSDPVLGGPTPFGAVVAGLATTPTGIHHDGTQHGLQLSLRPAAVRTLFGCPAAALAGTSVELADVVGPDADRLRDRLHGLTTWSERFAEVEATLLDWAERARRDRGAHPETLEAWRAIGASGGAVRVRSVAASVGWSMRRLQREFGAEYGLSPKAAARIRRFERSVPLVAGGGVGLTEVALRCGWSDHAHMDRDWRQLAGTSPTRWRSEDVLAEPVPRG